MNKLTIHHLAKRLPYGLKFKLPITSERYESYVENCGWGWGFAHTLETAIEAGYKDALDLNGSWLSQPTPFIATEEGRLFLGQMVNSLGFDEDDVFLDEVKPILFPLSSLTQEITVNGETFVPIERLQHNSCFKVGNKEINWLNVDQLPYWAHRALISWHIDTDNLVPQGLAISVFDLPENPYK